MAIGRVLEALEALLLAPNRVLRLFDGHVCVNRDCRMVWTGQGMASKMQLTRSRTLCFICTTVLLIWVCILGPPHF